ncbi:MAG TPA: TonB-dependent receptor [Rhodanobacteraceae bacterium]|jgi:TonB-dependent receptor|nr:TonB-dependent receptor [Rhodanobacteraceae bacterium]
MPIVHRKSPLALAITASLFALVATSAAASPQTTNPAETQPAPAATGQPAPASSQAQAQKAKPKAGEPADKGQPQTLSVVNVVGVRASQMRAIELKRTAPNIQDSITAESIGQLPDVTISDALQRVTGVQINRDAGVGSSVNVRGLPEVGTMLNDEVFITPDQIDSQQPDFSLLPASLFRGVDVLKSSTSDMADAGISGSLNLHTYRPWDLPNGFTYSYAAQGERGDVTDKWGPEVSGLVSYNGGRWGLLLSADVANTRRENSNEGLDQYGVVFNGENAASADSYFGFVTPWNGVPLPSQIKQNPDGSVDVNGDGKSDGVFMGSQNIALYDTATQRRRKAGNASFQADLGNGFTLTSDYFFARQDQYDRNVGIQFNSSNWLGATYVPLQSQNTGAIVQGDGYGTPEPGWNNMQLYTTQVYEKWPGDIESFSQITQKDSIAKNFNLQVNFDNGGPFTASLRGIRDTAHQVNIETDLNISDADGGLWPNSLMPGVPDDVVAPGVYIYPEQLGGNRVFNPGGIPQNTLPFVADFRNRNLGISMPVDLAAHLADPNGWALKTLESGDNYDRSVGLTALRFDGHYDFDNGIRLDFGVRNSLRNANNLGFTLVAPVYAGMGASDPNGCLARYVAADVPLDQEGCTAGNAIGYYRAGMLSAQPLSKTPPLLANNWKEYQNLLGSGITFWAIDPYSMDNPESYWQSLYPGSRRFTEPGNTWAVWMKQTSGYLQVDLDGHIGSLPYSANVGMRVVRTNLDVTQHVVGAANPYGLPAEDGGTEVTRRSYKDYLPSLNFALDLTDDLKLRLAYSKNMMPLNLSTWGGGLSVNYSRATTPDGGQLFRVTSGSSPGNPNLDPWRSKNYSASLEYYFNPTTMISLAAFRINVQSFIVNGSYIDCSLPDEDGVVRNRCVPISSPVQGTGNSLHGLELDYRQAFTFLPGLLKNTGIEVNGTYAPSSTGLTDLAGNKIPFQDNSKESGNLILWYQDSRWQGRVALNYRSKQAVAQDVNTIPGMEEYIAPQKYIDASVSYKINKYATVFLQGSNLSNEQQRYYLVWPDQEGHAQMFERMYTIGIRGQF